MIKLVRFSFRQRKIDVRNRVRIGSATQYANAKCGNIFLFFIFDVIQNENAELVFIIFFNYHGCALLRNEISDVD